MFAAISTKDYYFLKNDLRFNLLMPFMQAEHHAYKSADGTVYIIHGGMMVIWCSIDGFLNPAGLPELIDRHKVTKVFSSGKFERSFGLKRILIPYFRKSIISPDISGQMLIAKDRHTELVARFMENFDDESLDGIFRDKNYIKIAYWLIRQRIVFLWQDKEITSMCAVLSRDENYARINYVFTKGDFRNRGYAQMLVHTVSCNLLKEHCVPVLYTDKNCVASNAVYKKIGFKELGEIYEYDIT